MDSIPILFDPSSQLPRFPQVMEQVQSLHTSYPCVADVGYIQQQFAAGAPPSLVVSAVVALSCSFVGFDCRRIVHHCLIDSASQIP